MKSYNNTVHSSLGRPPSNVNKGNKSEVRLDQYLLRRRLRLHRYKQHMQFNIGDQVRVSYRREPFDREYGQHWSREIFVIAEGRMRIGIPIYKLNDWMGNLLKVRSTKHSYRRCRHTRTTVSKLKRFSDVGNEKEKPN